MPLVLLVLLLKDAALIVISAFHCQSQAIYPIPADSFHFIPADSIHGILTQYSHPSSIHPIQINQRHNS